MAAKIIWAEIALMPQQVEELQRLFIESLRTDPISEGEPPGILLAQVFPYEDKGLTPHMKVAFYPADCGGQTMVETHGNIVARYKMRKIKSLLAPYKTAR